VIRRRLSNGHPPTLESQLAWFQEQAANPDNSPRDRELWQQLADELQLRLNPPTGDQPSLW
jgi:hypothetical protein